MTGMVVVRSKIRFTAAATGALAAGPVATDFFGRDKSRLGDQLAGIGNCARHWPDWAGGTILSLLAFRRFRSRADRGGTEQEKGFPDEATGWNIQWGRVPMGVVGPQRTIRPSGPSVTFDVICLQEVAVGFCRACKAACRNDGWPAWPPPFRDTRRSFAWRFDLPDGGVGRSRFGNLTPVAHAGRTGFRHSLPCPPEEGVPSIAAGASKVVVDGPHGPIRVLNTHLEYYSASSA